MPQQARPKRRYQTEDSLNQFNALSTVVKTAPKNPSEGGRIIQEFRGAEKRRTRVDDLLARFEEVRRAEQLDETAAEMLNRVYV